MPRIIRVDVLDDDTLDIELSNGNLILFKLRSAAQGSRDFADAMPQIAGRNPVTDGVSVYWAGGPSLTLDQILELMMKTDR